ncbi:sulfatase family protein [Phycisphaera mikurensis]|uniref:Sulfatase n=1 Tax=Phycisphaera mikurensis (strain NBRC 102666 / KCTC 22515 / FYK2301M01) TaxID=1142394 RepID=I0IDH8_PHYMF|nr:sulfatase-like hydrolase/transferase [Phycisphaera mikurensis]MBB6441137.1 arylsulfatase A-like enzyme [Phycisphaera mikurensis]BAM03316.1 sulfatase [Phycisphaera mikurensis NBRC 102666]
MPARPNLLVIMTDQQRADSLGCLGNHAVATPHLDGLAQSGVLFENAWCTNPICTPSRASFLTGHHLPRHQVETIDGELDPEEVLFPERLRGAGYRTGLVGKLHAQSGAIESRRRHPHDGFDVYDLYYGGGAMMGSPLNAYAPWVEARRPDVYQLLVEHEKAAGPIPAEVHMNAWAAERAAAFLDAEGGGGRPWFLMVSVFDPHNPYDDHPPEAEARVDEAALPPPIPPPAPGTVPPGVARHARDNYFGDYAEMTDEQVRRMRTGYHAEVGMIDDLVGRLLTHLDARGLAEETLVLFLSDHGDLLGDHGLLVKGPVVYDANLRVPAIVRWPGRVEAGMRHAGPIQLNDLTATLLHAAGVDAELPDAIDPLGCRRREIAINAYRNSGLGAGHKPHDPPIHLTCATDGRWTLARYHAGPGDPTPRGTQLFDRVADANQLHDLAGEPAGAEAEARLGAAINGFLAMEASP